jgi:5,5'-dehydrodivanillate O-demethylase oxygenase subunit
MNEHENEVLTRVGAGTPCGEMLRRYWWPVAAAESLKAAPLAVKLLGEDLVVFRAVDGTIGLLGRYCPHRNVSLEYGRVEARGLRCCYHGWLFDAHGKCLEQPAEPAASDFKDKIRHTAYVAREVAGLIFAYIGPQPVPSFPRYDLLFQEDCHRVVVGREIHVNWLQRTENVVDPHHATCLHASVYPEIALRPPAVDWDPTPHGIRIESRFPNGLADVVHQIFPASLRVHVVRVGRRPMHLLGFNTPIDDVETVFWNVWAYQSAERPFILRTEPMQKTERGVYTRVEDGWWNIWERQQDDAAMDNIGPGRIAPRTTENLATSDRGVVLYRKQVWEAIEAVAAGKDPLGVIRDGAHTGTIDFDARKIGFDYDPEKIRDPELGAKLRIGDPWVNEARSTEKAL